MTGEWLNLVLAALITLASIYALARLTARIYAPALVRGGARISWRNALRLRGEQS